jgi:hypothetical protein
MQIVAVVDCATLMYTGDELSTSSILPYKCTAKPSMDGLCYSASSSQLQEGFMQRETWPAFAMWRCRLDCSEVIVIYTATNVEKETLCWR